MSQRSVPSASIHKKSFACPICGAHSTQTWYRIKAEQLTSESGTPDMLSLNEIVEIEMNLLSIKDKVEREFVTGLTEKARKLLSGELFLSKTKDSNYGLPILENVHVNFCYTCKKPSIWLHDRLIYPQALNAPLPNGDLSADVLRDYEEARQILDLSPRGASALLRLAIEKICIELGAEGEDINSQIASLVGKGLSDPVQKALDAVRVVGNEAVHPGVLDLKDDRDTATHLFHLVNIIADELISRNKKIQGVYDMIPEGKREAIEKRNEKARTKN